MIYLVTGNLQLFESENYKVISKEESLSLMSSWKLIQLDTETDGRDAHINKLLCIQFGNIEGTIQIVVDATTVDIKIYKDIIESSYCVGHNLKFDLQFLFNYGIIPRKVYDTMIVEQLLYLGYPSGMISYSLKEVAWRRLNKYLDKSTRGEIIWRGLDDKVIIYAASDVEILGDIMKSQIQDCKDKECTVGAKLECDFVPSIAYLEWCGIKLDQDKWKAKMAKDKEKLKEAEDKLNAYCITHPKLQKWVIVKTQGDLFEGWDTKSYWNIDWQKDEAKKPIKALGFDLKTVSKTTKQETESVMEKVLSSQKGIDDTFLKLYFDYQGFYKVTTSFGQGHLNLINPNTGRIHTNYWQIGTASGRMSSGSGTNPDLAKLKGLPAKSVKMLNFQQLPHDEETRSCFVSESENLFCSCDFSAMEARIGAEVYNETTLLDEFLYGSGDTHAAYAKVVFADELKDVAVKDIKKLRPDLRNKVKSVEFAVQFGSDGTAVAPQLGISVEEARQLVNNLLKGMTGLANFKASGSKKVRSLGYVEAHPLTGHKCYWWDHKKWLDRQNSFTSAFWDEYKAKHKGTGDDVAKEVKEHFQAASKWDRMALNIPTQGGGAIVLKEAAIRLFDYIVDNNYFGKILLVNLTHDEINTEFPKDFTEWPNIVSKTMEEAAAKYYTKLPIPAESSVGTCWIH
jgi:DNA polymerase-1